MTKEYLEQQLHKYNGLISCVLFLGGEWQPEALIALLKFVRKKGLETCLYTGAEDVSLAISEQLTYLKVGPWIAHRGGLESPATNQRFYDLRNKQLLNNEFQRRK